MKKTSAKENFHRDENGYLLTILSEYPDPAMDCLPLDFPNIIVHKFPLCLSQFDLAYGYLSQGVLSNVFRVIRIEIYIDSRY